MRSFWIWFTALAVIWTIAVLHAFVSHAEQPDITWLIVGSALFFAFFFLVPLFRKRSGILILMISAAALLAIVTLWPVKDVDPNPFTLLVLSILAGKAVYRLPPLHAAGVGAILFLGALAPYFWGYPSLPPAFISLYSALLAQAFAVFRTTSVREQEASHARDALLSECRKLKRRSASDEELARQEERTQIARDIHDSVGHKLTALLMQLEVFRLQNDEQGASLKQLKHLAQESLNETRNAVKALKRHDGGGLTAIMGLIRRLEAESFIRVNFSVKQGALSVPLSNEQAVVVYRVVQEALTNVMRHSKAREADITFEGPGGSVFRFRVSNRVADDVIIREGFGLNAMRERIEQAGGELKIMHRDGRFIVLGTFNIKHNTNRSMGEDRHDSNTAR